MFLDLPPPWRRLLLFMFGAACTVVVAAGVRSVAGLLNPVLVAGFLALLLLPVLQRLRPLLGSAVAVVVVVLVVVLGGLALVGFVGASLRQLALELPRYQEQLRMLADSVVHALAARGIDAAGYVESALSGPRVASTLLNTSAWVARAVGDLLLTFLIFAFMLAGMAELERRASRESPDHSPLAYRFLAFAGTIRGYMAARGGLGLVEASLDYLLLLTVGVEYALLWGVYSFVLTFVPNIGVTLSLLPPMLLALLSQGWHSALIVLIGYYAISTVLGNVVGPRVIGRRLHISPLLSFLSVLFWAWLLGPTGALLSVPLTVLIRDLAFGPAEEIGPALTEPALAAASPTPPAAPAAAAITAAPTPPAEPSPP